jgi:hypothetical protein
MGRFFRKLRSSSDQPERVQFSERDGVLTVSGSQERYRRPDDYLEIALTKLQYTGEMWSSDFFLIHGRERPFSAEKFQFTEVLRGEGAFDKGRTLHLLTTSMEGIGTVSVEIRPFYLQVDEGRSFGKRLDVWTGTLSFWAEEESVTLGVLVPRRSLEPFASCTAGIA